MQPVGQQPCPALRAPAAGWRRPLTLRVPAAGQGCSRSNRPEHTGSAAPPVLPLPQSSDSRYQGFWHGYHQILILTDRSPWVPLQLAAARQDSARPGHEFSRHSPKQMFDLVEIGHCLPLFNPIRLEKAEKLSEVTADLLTIVISNAVSRTAKSEVSDWRHNLFLLSFPF